MSTVLIAHTPVTTTASFIEVHNDMKPGKHTFTLVVVDDDGNRSATAQATVIVRGSKLTEQRSGTIK